VRRDVRIVLASNSPRRRALLTELLGWDVLFLSPDVEEDVEVFPSPAEAVKRLATKKPHRRRLFIQTFT